MLEVQLERFVSEARKLAKEGLTIVQIEGEDNGGDRNVPVHFLWKGIVLSHVNTELKATLVTELVKRLTKCCIRVDHTKKGEAAKLAVPVSFIGREESPDESPLHSSTSSSTG